MNDITFRRLTPALLDDFLHFFDNDAFSDHEEWAGCYCLESHIPDEGNRYSSPAERREAVSELIRDGVMTGYLLYDGGAVIGWCNAGDKTGYLPICGDSAFATDPPEPGRIKIIYCIDIAPQYRGMGIANLIFERVLADAKAEGYSYVEGYPYTDAELPYQYKGPARLYEKFGFELLRKEDWFCIMRKSL